MNQEYIIINKTAIEKKIAELKKQRDEYAFNPNRTDDYYRYNSMIKVLKEILSQSTPFIPEIEKAYNAGKLHNELSITFDNPQGRYISNLKLNI